jgi:hypothetical protein
MHILALTIVPITLATVQVPNLALTHTKRITVYHLKGLFLFTHHRYMIYRVLSWSSSNISEPLNTKILTIP